MNVDYLCKSRKGLDRKFTFAFRYGNIISLIEIWQPANTGLLAINK